MRKQAAVFSYTRRAIVVSRQQHIFLISLKNDAQSLLHRDQNLPTLLLNRQE